MKLSVLFVLTTIVTTISFGGNAFAQKITFVTSVDEHDNSFFGEGILQIIIVDEGSDDDGTVEEISVEIEGELDAGDSNSVDITVPETDDNTGRFEFFLAHVDADAVVPSDLNPRNSAGVEGDGGCVTDCAPFVTFGPGGDLDIAAALYDKLAFEIKAGNSAIKVKYEETAGALDLDRDSYGSSSYVYVSVKDQDANLNPFERDEFTVDPSSGPNDDLLTLDGGNLEDIITFRETGDNTAVFEGRYRLGESIIATSESLVLTLREKANYDASLAASENDSNAIDEISFTIGNSDGTVSIGGGQQAVPTWDASLAADKDLYAVGESVYITITDKDANVNPSAVDSIQVDISSRESRILVTATETGVNTSIFRVSFLLAETTGADAIKAGRIVTVTYTDQHPADYAEKIQAGQDPMKDFALEINVQLPVKTGIETTDIASPVARDFTGGHGPYSIGDSITLSTIVANNNDEPQEFLVLIEVRDTNGSTVYLALQGGTLEPSGSIDVGALWQPDQVGTFQVRTFVINNFEEAEVLSRVAVSEIIIT